MSGLQLEQLDSAPLTSHAGEGQPGFGHVVMPGLQKNKQKHSWPLDLREPKGLSRVLLVQIDHKRVGKEILLLMGGVAVQRDCKVADTGREREGWSFLPSTTSGQVT